MIGRWVKTFLGRLLSVGRETAPQVARVRVEESKVSPEAVLHDGVVVVHSSIQGYTYVSPNSLVVYADVGRFCSIGQDVHIGLFQHPSRGHVSTHPAFFSINNSGAKRSFVARPTFDDRPKRTTIGHDVWIGNRAVVPGGITIGNGAIVAAGAIVTKDVPPYGIVGGNPARLIRYRFEDADIRLIQQTGWWNLPEDVLREVAIDFQSVDQFKSALYRAGIKN